MEFCGRLYSGSTLRMLVDCPPDKQIGEVEPMNVTQLLSLAINIVGKMSLKYQTDKSISTDNVTNHRLTV